MSHIIIRTDTRRKSIKIFFRHLKTFSIVRVNKCSECWGIYNLLYMDALMYNIYSHFEMLKLLKISKLYINTID